MDGEVIAGDEVLYDASEGISKPADYYRCRVIEADSSRLIIKIVEHVASHRIYEKQMTLAVARVFCIPAVYKDGIDNWV